MMKRNEIKQGMYVRISNEFTDTFQSLLRRGRYMWVEYPDKTPDDGVSAGVTRGGVIFYEFSFQKPVSNAFLYPVSEKETAIIQNIGENKKLFPEFHRLGRKIERRMNQLEDILKDELRLNCFDLWSISDSVHFKNRILDSLKGKDEDFLDYTDIIDDIVELFKEFEKLILKLTKLEEKVVRGIQSDN